MDVLTDPLHYEFVRHALVVCTVGGALCGVIGAFIVVRGMSYLGHGLSHAIFGGAALSAALGGNLFVGAGLWGIGSGVAVTRMGRPRRGRTIGADAAIGVITTAGFALGIALLGRYPRVNRSIEATVFGSVLGVSTGDQWLVIATAVLIVAAIVGWYRPLLFTSFDHDVAEASGVPTGRIDALLMILVCGAILSTMRVVGVTLIAAAIVVPASTARMLTDSFARMLVLAGAIGAVTGLAGMYLSYHLDISSGATIVLVQFLAFAAATVGHRVTDRVRPAPPADGTAAATAR